MKPILPRGVPQNSADLVRKALRFQARLEAEVTPTAQDLREVADLLSRTAEALQSVETELLAKAERIYAHQLLMDRRLLGLEKSPLVKLAHFLSGPVISLYNRTASLFRTPQGRRALLSSEYRRWFTERERHSAGLLDEQRREFTQWKKRPLVSIIIDAQPDNAQKLSSTLASIEAQTYPHWEVCIALDGAGAYTDAALASFQERTGKLRAPETRPGCSRDERLRRAIQDSSGDAIVFLEASDRLAASALFFLCERVQAKPDALIYTDQDFIDEAGEPVLPVFKPGWSPRLAEECAYTGGAVLIPRDLCVSAFETPAGAGAESHAILLNASRDHPVEHVDRILYHERAAPNWIDAPVLLPRSAKVSRPAVSRRSPVSSAAADIVICSRTERLARRCVDAIRSTTARVRADITLVEHVSEAKFGAIPATRRIPFEGRFNFSVMNNMGAAGGAAPVVVLMNDDVIALEEGWLEGLIEPLQDLGVGIVGAVLRYPDGAIQHAGIVTGIADGAGHAGRFARSSDLWPWLNMTREVGGVTGACIALRREVWSELNGLDPAFPNNYNDVDLCLRARAQGYRVVCVSGLRLIHEECRTRAGVTHLAERERLYARWPEVFSRTDPFYSSSLAATEQIALGYD
jgi:O-antigen biosynthesis protein